MPSKIVTFTLNGREVEVMAKPLATLQYVLREQLSLTSPKIGCKQGGCGGCTVLIDGEPMLSCLLPVEDVEGKSVTTLEGISQDGLSALQEEFLNHFAVQCGFCTPGMLMVAKALLDHNPQPSREQIIDAISGNVCRCTGYVPIIEAVEAAAQRMNGHGG